MIRAMKRVYLLYTQDNQDAVVSRLQKLGLLHLEETPLDETLSSGGRSARNLAEDRKRVENLLIKAHGTRDLLAEVDGVPLRPSKEAYPTRLEDAFQSLRTLLDPLEGRLKALVGERRELHDRLAAGERLAEPIRVSEELLKTLPRGGYTFVPAILAPDQRAALPEILRVLAQEGGYRFAVAHQNLSAERIELIVAARPEYASAVTEYLEAKGIRPLALPSHVPQEFVDGVAHLKADAIAIPRRLREIDEELRALAHEHAGGIATLTNALENRLAQLEAATGFGYTDYTLLVTGWIPQDEFARFQAVLGKEFPGIIVREETGRYPYEEVPVAFQESRWARPYQLFLLRLTCYCYSPKLNTTCLLPSFAR